MRRALIYIFIFLGICAALMGMSKLANTTILSYYMPDLMDELAEKFVKEDTIYIDGQMLSVYLHSSSERFMLDGKKFESFGGTNQYNELKGRTFKVEREGLPYEDYLRITTLGHVEGEFIRLSSIFQINNAIKYKTIIVNILALVVGIALYVTYEYNSKQRMIVIDGN